MSVELYQEFGRGSDDRRLLRRKLLKFNVIVDTYRIWDDGLLVTVDQDCGIRNVERRRAYVHYICQLRRSRELV